MRAERKTFDRARRQRREMSLPEVLLWQALRGKAAGGLRFRNHHPISRLTLDFYCPSAKLGLEIDGEAHGRGDQPDRDARRDGFLASRGIRVLRVPAVDILRPDGLEDVVRGIVAAALEGARSLRDQGLAPSGSLRSPPPP